MTSRPDRYYGSSGAVPLSGTLLMLVGGTVLAFAASLLYSFAELHVTHQKLKALIACVFALLMGAAFMGLARGGAVRHRPFAGLVGLVLGILTLYFAWMWFFLIGRGWNWQDLFPDPVALWNDIGAQAQKGLWVNRRGVPIGPTELTIGWSVEAVVVLVASAWIASSNAAPFCENCGRWTIAHPARTLPYAVRETLAQALEDERYDELFNLTQRPATAGHSITAVVQCCPDCDESNFLTLNAVVTKNPRKPDKTETAPFLVNLAVPATVAAWVRAGIPAQETLASDAEAADALEPI
jgi:hypothetical protein